jgi:UDP-N-acetylmuramate dehydrogenase
VKELLKLAPESRLDEPLAAHCTMRVGGPCRALVKPENPDELRAALEWLHRAGVPFKVVGKGANLLIADTGYEGAIVVLGDGFNWLERKDDSTFNAGAGLSLASFCHQLARLGIAGFEFAAQIPGTVGGGLVNNAGAYGQDFTHLVRDATIVRADGTQETLTREQLELRYRGSKIKNSSGICLVGATFAGQPADPEAIKAKITEYGKHRAATQPVKDYTAGCVFKNPTDGKAGQLIESAGLKGATVGRAIVSPKHANFIVNLGKATCQEVRDLIRTVQQRVHDRFSVELETEVEFVGF